VFAMRICTSLLALLTLSAVPGLEPSVAYHAYANSKVAGGATAPINTLGDESLSVFVRNARAPAAASSTRAVTVVLIPGPVGSAFSMRHITDVLAAESIATVVIDPLGMGTSARPEVADYTLTRQASRIRAVLDTLRIARAIVVAQGTSATVALHLAASDPTRIAAVLSLAGGPVDHQGTKGVKLALAFAPLIDNAVGRAIGRRKFRGAVREQSANDAWCTDDVLRAYLRPFESNVRGGLRALRAMSEAVEPVPIGSRLHLIQAPVRLLVGEKHSANSPTDEQLLLLSQKVAHFQVDTIARAGTMLHEERPDAVTAAIHDLIRDLPSAGTRP